MSFILPETIDSHKRIHEPIKTLHQFLKGAIQRELFSERALRELKKRAVYDATSTFSCSS
jgi:hypothetical protein